MDEIITQMKKTLNKYGRYIEELEKEENKTRSTNGK